MDASQRILSAERVRGHAPRIDGDLGDPVWELAPVATDFLQVEPNEGDPATEPTEARVLYDDQALYVAIRAYDSRPDSIVAQLTRRDQSSHSDRVHFLVDSYFDRRTAFHFAVNPRGVKLDLYRYDDWMEDPGWDAVWDVATRVDSLGWTAEFRIPLSQLRFSGAPVQTWGINFGREIARRNEISVWSPLSQQDKAVVSRSGELRGIRDLSPPRLIEVLPYTVARVTRAPGDPANPFYRGTDLGGALGADIKIGLASDLTVDLTVNPDFGQVQADPGQVNLTAFESFFPERRPFFLEGSSIFRFQLGLGEGDAANEALFYSRRVGRTPQGAVSVGDGWVHRPTSTRILSAGKLSGKTENGWSVGVLGAVTASEEARIARPDGSRESATVEPLSNYSVVRLQRDFREGGTAVGVLGTTALRNRSEAEALALRNRAFTGGMDFRHRFRQGTMEFRSYLLGSHVAGYQEAIRLTQLSPARYLQRPDADHVSFVPTATSLAGWSGTAELWKVGGGPWQFAAVTLARSPGFEPNDVGFMREADLIQQLAFVGYRQNRPGRHLRNWGIYTNLWSGWTFGWEHISYGTSVNGHATFNNNWNLYAGVYMSRGTLDPRLLRGGPALRTEDQFNGWFGVDSDSRRDLQASWHIDWLIRPDARSWMLSTSPKLRWRPSERATVQMGPFLNRGVEDRQWVGRVASADGSHYLFGRMDQTTFGLTLRADVALSPNLTLQYYAQPFMAAGSYGEFKQVTNPRARGYAARFRPVAVEADEGRYRADLDGNGARESFRNPDFDFSQLRSNAVVRWEYRPGSTLFLVWSQARDHVSQRGTFRLADGLNTLFRQEAQNVLMLKIDYWLKL